MLTLIQLSKVEPSRGYYDRDDEGSRPAEATRPAYVNIECIRNIQPRKNNAVGSRLTFSDGGGYAVRETPDEIFAMLPADGTVLIRRSADVVAMIASAN